MTERGDIFAAEAYALGKMLDNSSWLKGDRVLRDNITPCDFDWVLDNNGAVLYAALESSIDQWRSMSIGQMRAYQAAIKKGVHCAVICRHNVKPDERRKIDTRTDIVSFQVMVFELASFRISRVVDGNEHWQNFVFAWFRNPDGLRGEVIERSTHF